MIDTSRTRVNLWTPWGADSSGIANYVRLLAPYLNQHVDLTIVHPHESDHVLRSRTPSEVRGGSLDAADVNVFHIGNNVDFHHWMLPELYRSGGIVVLHDWSLFDLIRPLLYRTRYLWDKERALNLESDPQMHRHRHDPGFLMQHPMNQRILEAADAVITHTPWVRDHALSLHHELDIRYIPHAGPVLARTTPGANAPITVLGGLGRHKQIGTVLDAFSDVVKTHPDARLRIVGRSDDRREIGRLRRHARHLGLAHRVEWHLDVDRATYLRLLNESLIVVTLRSETAGEMSGVLIEAWSAGRVAVTSDQPQFQFFDERYCRRIPLTNAATSRLTTELLRALDHRDELEEDGAAARAQIEGDYRFENVAEQHAAVIREFARRTDPAAGLNIFGSWGTPSGLGEVARRLAQSCVDGQITVSAPPGFRLPDYDSSLVPSLVSSLDHTARYGINLLTANINEMHVVDPKVLGTQRARRWNIGLWIYEFGEIASSIASRVHLVDEIWCGSDFALSSFRRYFDGPTTKLHNVVRLRPQHQPASAVRQKYGLADQSVVVFFSFDFFSGWARKNPLAVIAAFADASRQNPDVTAQLVMKVSHVPDEYRRILTKHLAPMGGVLIDEHLSDEELGDLFHAIDIYCSLHRAEGFGLGMAEAMAMGKTVVATRYSGNLEFMNDNNSLLVDATMTAFTSQDASANPGMERIVRVGSLWAEPDHASAVAALSEAFVPARRDELGRAAREYLFENFSDVAAARIVRTRLDELDSELRRFRTNWPVVSP